MKKFTFKKDFVNFCILLLLFIALIILSVYLFPFFKALTTEESRNLLIDYIHSKGFAGVFILLGLQILQVVVAIIPGEAIEIIAGIIYGTVGGYIICTIGTILSSILVFFLVKKLGYNFIVKMFSTDKLNKFKFLHDPQKLDIIIFILFFIPGTPKDMLTYIVPFTQIKPSRFLLISSIARIPSIISSTYAGASLIEGNYHISIIVFAITGALAILGIIFNDKIISIIHKFKK